MIQIPGIAVKEKIAEGGASYIYLGTHLRRGATCAIKVLKDALKHDSSQIKAFKNESKLLLAVRHPCIIEVWESGSVGDDYYYVMEYFASKNLKNLILNKSPLLRDWVPLAIRVSDAILYLHLNSMVHRDIKPENILVNETGAVKLIDLSIAMKRTFLTSIFNKPPSVAAGTPSYMSPEQIMGKSCDQRSDIYSLGAVLYELLTGKPPFLGKSQEEILTKHMKEKPAPPGEVNRDIPLDVSDLIVRMLAKSPDDRVEDMNMVLYELKKIQRKIPSRAPVRPSAADRRSTRILVQDGFCQYRLSEEAEGLKPPQGAKRPVTNLSRHGLGFVCDADLPMDHILDIAIHLRGMRTPIYVRGRVAWCQRVKDASLRTIGVRITARSKEYQVAYEELKSRTKTGTQEI
ncbi:MAG: protein kinase [Planctomycetes bacterium]|nr:protein kinase [Planctomycetota bacterium]